MAGVDVVGKVPGVLKAVSRSSAHSNTLSRPKRGRTLNTYKEQLKDVDKAWNLPINIIVLIPVDLMKSVVIEMLSESRQHQSRNYS